MNGTKSSLSPTLAGQNNRVHENFSNPELIMQTTRVHQKRVDASNPNCHHTYPKTHAHGYSLQPHSPSDLESALQPRGLFMKFVMTRPDQVDGAPDDQTAAVRPGETPSADPNPERSIRSAF